MIVKARLIVIHVHPHLVGVVFGIGVFAQLPVGTPAAVGAIHQVHQAFVLALVVAVVIDGDQVDIFVEYKFMCVAYAVGENIIIAAIGLAATIHTAVGVIPMLAGGV